MVTQFSLLLRHCSVRAVASCGSLRMLRRQRISVCFMRTRRRLLVTLPLHGCTSLATVLHAPDRHHGEDAISAWWQETLDFLKRLCPSGVLVIAMIDANAEVGSGGLGGLPFHWKQGCRSGNLSWKFVASFLCGAFVDSACHSSRADFLPRMEVAPTWRHTTGNWRRIDFVVLPLQWLSACSNAHTWQHGELALQVREDHRAASVDVSLQLPCTGQRVNRNFASWRALKLPDVAQRSEACLAGLSTGTLTGWKLLLPIGSHHLRNCCSA